MSRTRFPEGHNFRPHKHPANIASAALDDIVGQRCHLLPGHDEGRAGNARYEVKELTECHDHESAKPEV